MDETPLESWKEIAAYLQRQSKTVRRWEKEEGLPVHRHSHKSRSSVYAYPSEIDAWRAGRSVASELEPEPVAIRPFWKLPAFATTILLSVVMVGSGVPDQLALAQQSHTLAKRLLFTSPDGVDRDGTFTPDGRKMLYTDWSDSQDLVVRDMKSGKESRMFAKPAQPEDRDAYAQVAVYSPDLKQLAYFWDPAGPNDKKVQLRVMENKPGGKFRTLIDQEDNYFPVSWFPDAKFLLCVMRKQDRTQFLTRVNVADGSVKVLKALEWRSSAENPSLSPDGRYVVYSALAVNPSAPPTNGQIARTQNVGGDRHIYLLAVDGSGETEIVKTASLNKHPVWTPDGKHVLFTSDRSGKLDLWSLTVENGKAPGAPSLVSPEIGDVYGFGVFRGSYYYAYRQPNTAYIRIYRPGTGSAGPQELESFVGSRASWSPDGKSIAFKRRHPGGTANDSDLVVHSLETGDERTYTTNLGLTANGAPVWFHDGKSIMTGLHGPEGPRGTYRIDVTSGNFTKLPAGGRILSYDDRTAYSVTPESGTTPARVVAYDMTTGQEREILKSPALGMNFGPSIGLSPDGRTLAVGWFDRIQQGARIHIGRVAVDGTGYRELFVGTDQVSGGPIIGWTKDGRSILFRQEQPGGAAHWGVMSIPADGGGTATLVMATNGNGGVDLSPDGSRFAVTTQEGGDQLWALDNVLYALK